jgi:hypothetical protein
MKKQRIEAIREQFDSRFNDMTEAEKYDMIEELLSALEDLFYQGGITS